MLSCTQNASCIIGHRLEIPVFAAVRKMPMVLSKDVPVDMLVKLDERIFQLGEFFEQKMIRMIVKKAEWVDMFHDN